MRRLSTKYEYGDNKEVVKLKGTIFVFTKEEENSDNRCLHRRPKKRGHKSCYRNIVVHLLFVSLCHSFRVSRTGVHLLIPFER